MLLAAITVGFPVLMLSVVGSPLPERLLPPQELIDSLAVRDDGTLFIGAS